MKKYFSVFQVSIYSSLRSLQGEVQTLYSTCLVPEDLHDLFLEEVKLDESSEGSIAVLPCSTFQNMHPLGKKKIFYT